MACLSTFSTPCTVTWSSLYLLKTWQRPANSLFTLLLRRRNWLQVLWTSLSYLKPYRMSKREPCSPHFWSEDIWTRSTVSSHSHSQVSWWWRPTSGGHSCSWPAWISVAVQKGIPIMPQTFRIFIWWWGCLLGPLSPHIHGFPLAVHLPHTEDHQL